jgi:hypothetical protein
MAPAIDNSKIAERMKIQDTGSYRNVRSLNPFDFLEHTYEGSNGYRDCSYLIPHPREVFYETRRDSSYYTNVFGHVVNAMVDQVFENDIPRSSTSTLFDAFMENADGLGASLQEIIEDTMYLARCCDAAFVVMDNYPANVQPATIAQAAKQRIVPYIYIKRMQDVFAVTEDSSGKLTSVDFYDEKISVQMDKKTVEVQTYRHWTNMLCEVYYFAEKGRVSVSIVNHNLHVLPVIPVTNFSRRKRVSKIKSSIPSMYSLAYLCYALFNKESEVVSLEQYQCFSIFYVSGRINSGSLGHANVIEVPLDAKFPPGYASPDAAMMAGLVKNCDRLTESIYKVARQKGVVALVEQSGIAKEWDFRGEESTLKRTATAAHGLEVKIAELFGLYTHTVFEFTSTYPDHFSPTFEKDLVAETLDILKEMPPKPLERRLWLRLAKQIFGEDKQSGDTLIQEMENEPVSEGAGAGGIPAGILPPSTGAGGQPAPGAGS